MNKMKRNVYIPVSVNLSFSIRIKSSFQSGDCFKWVCRIEYVASADERIGTGIDQTLGGVFNDTAIYLNDSLKRSIINHLP